MTATPAKIPLRLSRTTSTFTHLGHPSGNTRSRRPDVPLTIAQQRQISEKMACRRPPLFTVPYVIELGADEVARLLDRCFYDLIDAERERSGAEIAHLSDDEYRAKLLTLTAQKP